MTNRAGRGSVLLLFPAIIILSVIFSGCDYITGAALDEPAITTAPRPRWVWSLLENTYPSTVIDRNTGKPIGDVSPEEAFGIMGTSSYLGNPVVIDVRTPGEYAGGYIWDAINIDYSSPDFKDRVAELAKNFTYIIYCRTGARSNLARNVMKELGFKYVINMTGGYSDWAAAGLPVNK
jgi:rhodanese-related sulfurtransferase